MKINSLNKFVTYIAVVFGVTIIILVLNFINEIIKVKVENFPVWVLPLVFSFIFVNILFYLSRRHFENDAMKTEFLSIISHKIRNPLTHIKWASETLMKTNLSADQKEQTTYILSANKKLVDLTDLLMTISRTKKDELIYRYEDMDISQLVNETIDSIQADIDNEGVKMNRSITPNLIATIDTPRIIFIIQTFIENAIHYGANSVIDISCSREGKNILFTVKDGGIGIAKEHLSSLFKKYYRSDEAKQIDSEGMGIALFMSKKIIGRHKGSIGVASQGNNMGSTFYFKLPLKK